MCRQFFALASMTTTEDPDTDSQDSDDNSSSYANACADRRSIHPAARRVASVILNGSEGRRWRGGWYRRRG